MDEGRLNPSICQISGEPGGNIVVRQSRLLPNIQLFVKKEWWEKGYEPRWVVIMYGRDLLTSAGGNFGLVSKDAAFKRIVKNHLYVGEDITVRDLL